MQHLERFQQGWQRRHFRHACARQERRRHRRATSQRRRMRQRQRLPAFGLSSLDRHHANTARVRCGHGLGKARRIAKSFDIQANACYPLIGGQFLDHIAQPHLRAVPDGQNETQRQRPTLHGQVDGNVRRLANQRRPALHPRTAMNVRPQRRAGAIVDQPIAVGPKNRHVTGGFQQRRLHGLALGFNFGPARCKARRPACAPG